MIPKFDLKLENGKVIPLEFGMWAKRRFFEVVKSADNPSIDEGTLSLVIMAGVIVGGHENHLLNTDQIDFVLNPVTNEMEPKRIPIHEGMKWIDLAGGEHSEEVKKCFATWEFFGADLGEVKVETPPKKRKSPGKK